MSLLSSSEETLVKASGIDEWPIIFQWQMSASSLLCHSMLSQLTEYQWRLTRQIRHKSSASRNEKIHSCRLSCNEIPDAQYYEVINAVIYSYLQTMKNYWLLVIQQYKSADYVYMLRINEHHTGRSWNVVVSLPAPLRGCVHAKLFPCRIRYCWSPPDMSTTTRYT